MNQVLDHCYTSFDGDRKIADGSLQANALAVKRALEGGAQGPVLIFDDDTGRCVEVDTRGSEAEVVARLAYSTLSDPVLASAAAQDDAPTIASLAGGLESRGRGRPKLGVVAREVTLLPRHWEWLASQPGGASVTLRRLVDEARRASGNQDRIRQAHECAYHFIEAIAGNRPNFEEATRALFANDRPRFAALIGTWPSDVYKHAIGLAFGAP